MQKETGSRSATADMRGHDHAQSDAREADYVRFLLIGIAIVALTLAAWTVYRVFLLAFAGVLVAIILRSLADLLVRWLRVPARWSLLAAGLLLVVVGAGIVALLGAQFVAQFEELTNTLPATLKGLMGRIEGLGGNIGGTLQSQMSSGAGSVLSGIASAGVMVAGGLTDLVLVLFTGVFLAQDPDLYKRGLVKLFPASQRERVAGALDNVGSALRLWLIGTLGSMALVGVLTGSLLWLAGVPSPLALGLLAALAEFVSFIGPIISGGIALLAASSVGFDTVLWTLLIMVGIQQVESNMITPVIQQRAVDLPPVLGLLGIVAAGTLFGGFGIILAVPLTVVAYVLVKRLYVRETLGEDVDVPGET
jgi:predicted PurR-regulated permease PerM